MMRLRWKLLILAIIGAPVAVVLAIVWLLAGSRMDYSGQLVLDGLQAPVTIRFDEYRRPYVSAESLDDALFAHGFLHARERLWQMDLLRRAGSARLGALLGEGLLATDKAMWRAGVPELAERLQSNASLALRSRVDSYVSGINAGIDSLRQPPPEYLLLRTEPERFTVMDAFNVAALMAFDVAGNHDREILRLALAEQLDPEHLRVFLVDQETDPDFPYIWSPSERSDSQSEPAAGDVRDDAPGRLDELLAFSRAVDANRRPAGASIRFGSNGWVVAPHKTADGHALFAFDSHDRLGLPNLFYEVHLFFGNGRQLRGWTVPGLPSFINGFNEHLAWGFTNIGDSQDLVRVRMDTDRADEYFDGRDWRPLERQRQTFEVRGGEAIIAERLITRYGPLISQNPPLALRWIAQDIGDLGMDALMDMNLATHRTEFEAAMQRFPAPVSNVTWADDEGHIGFRTIGLLPRRRLGQGLMPVEADGEDIWQGTVPSAEMPSLNDPERGYVAAANARVHGPEWAWLVGHDNAPGYRMRRIVDVLELSDHHDLDSMRRLQWDHYNGQAMQIAPNMLAVVNTDSGHQTALATLQDWLNDPVNARHAAGALIFESWYLALVERLFKPVLDSDLYERLLGQNYLVNHAVHALLADSESPWFKGDFEGMIGQSLDLALERLRARLGDDPSNWRLDAIQEFELEHALADAVPGLGRFLNRGPFPVGGGHATVGRAGFPYARPFRVNHGASVRTVIEMKQPLRAHAVIPGGQSGHLLSPHYDDQIGAWLDGRLLPLMTRPSGVDGPVLRLMPDESAVEIR